MNILMVCSEYAPLAKTGGLADAVAGLGGALARRGHDVRVLLPRYTHLPFDGAASEPIGGEHGFRYWALPNRVRSPRVYLLEMESPGAENLYFGDERDAARFVRLSVAALHLEAALHWRPDVLHCHDWQTALVPALRDAGRASPAVLTVHNMGHQGAYSARIIAGNGYADLSRLIDPRARAKRAVNFLRAGIQAAEAVTTVSPTYAREICEPLHGLGLESVLADRGADFTGILNGVDYSIWSPNTDPYLEEHFDARDPEPKQRLKLALCERLRLISTDRTPLVGVVSRLDPQKGIDLLIAALPALLRETRATLAIHGRGQRKLADKLQALARKHPSRISFTNGYDEPLAHQILAASDLLLMPSRYEPCGLMQLYGLRYGTIPVVRATGGLADTIRHFDPATGEGTGSVFDAATKAEFVRAVRTALAWFDVPPVWSTIISNAVRADFSWDKSTEAYEGVYSRAIGRRSG